MWLFRPPFQRFQQHPPVVLRRFFKSDRSARSRACAARAHIALFLFAKLFLFGAILSKRKSDKEILVPIVSVTDYSHKLSFIHFFFGTRAAKKKFAKRNGVYRATRPVPAPLRVERHLWKGGRNNRGGSANTPINPNLHNKKAHTFRVGFSVISSFAFGVLILYLCRDRILSAFSLCTLSG